MHVQMTCLTLLGLLVYHEPGPVTKFAVATSCVSVLWRLTEEQSNLDVLLISITCLAPAIYYLLMAGDQKTSSKPRISEVYSTSHFLLNAPDSTLWQNMGIWTSDSSFRQSCERLVDHLAATIKLGEADHLLDLAFGCGEELKYLQDRYRPMSIAGCTSHPLQYMKAVELCRDIPAVQIECEDAYHWCQKYKGMPLDCVIVVDSIYHFASRALFLKALTDNCLRTGSRLALTDILLSTSFERHYQSWYSIVLRRPLLRLLLFLLGVPWQNMKKRNGYLHDFECAGFIDMKVEVITSQVFPGLARYIETHRDIWRDKRWIGFSIFAVVLNWWLREDMVDFVVVTAVVGPEHHNCV